MLLQSPFAADRSPTTSIATDSETKAKNHQGMGRFANPTMAVMERNGIAKIRNLGTNNGWIGEQASRTKIGTTVSNTNKRARTSPRRHRVRQPRADPVQRSASAIGE